MLIDAWPAWTLFALRQVLFLVPLAATLVLAKVGPRKPRTLVGALFAFLYGHSVLFVGHVLAIQCGWWSYGGDFLKIMGFPADIWFGGALMWGPTLFLAFPGASPLFLVGLFVALNGLLLPSFSPFVTIGPGWLPGVVIVFLTAHLPALYLARWTSDDTNLPKRAFLLAVAYGCFAFFMLPAIIMKAMGGTWAVLLDRGWTSIVVATAALIVPLVMGLSAVQMFALHGAGTPIPLDPTKRLVRTGIYAYVSNPMQGATASAWIVIGAVLANPWIMLAAAMAVCFVQGMVRWHNRQDLAVRFPEGWPEYRANVPDWLPRWRPWTPERASLRYDPSARFQRSIIAALGRFGCPGLDIEAGLGSLRYREPNETREFAGVAAVAKAMNHVNLATALCGAGVLVVVLPLTACGAKVANWTQAYGHRRA